MFTCGHAKVILRALNEHCKSCTVARFGGNGNVGFVHADKSRGEYPVAVIAYMTNWCSDCTRSRRVLQRAGVAFAEIDIDKIPSAEDAMRALNGGSGKVPTILIDGVGGRVVLIEPTDQELSCALNDLLVRA